MRQIVLAFIFLTCFTPRIGSAREVTVQSLCQFLLAPPSSSETSDPWKNVTYGQLFKYILHRHESVGIGYWNQKQIIETQVQTASPARAQNDRQVVIFSLGRKWQTHQLDPKTSHEMIDQAYWAAVKLKKDMIGLKKEPTVDSCITRAWQFGVTDETLDRTQRLMDAAQDLKRDELERTSFEIAQDSRHFYEYAEVVPIDSIEEASTYLQTLQNHTRGLDVLFILHGSDDGLLLDASGSIVPRPFFRKLNESSRSITSIAIFSCYSAQVAKFYGSVFGQLNASGTQIFFPVDKIHFGDQNTVPLNALDVFIEKHAGALSALPTLDRDQNIIQQAL